MRFPFLFVCSVAVLFQVPAKAQNLIPNPGFEMRVDSPEYKFLNVNESIDWEIIGTADFFHTTFEASASIPENNRGLQEPFEGEGYAGIIIQGEFIYAPLLSTLEEGQLYELSFWVSPSGKARFFTDDIGAALTPTPPADRAEARTYPYQVKNEEGNILSDTSNWTQIKGRYLARGGERYILIGNFNDSNGTTQVASGVTGVPGWSYFYIDEVSLTQIELEDDNGGGSSKVRIESRPTIDTLFCESGQLLLSGEEEAESYYWEDIGVDQSIIVRAPGEYKVYSFYEDRVVIQVYQVGRIPCECNILIPTPNRRYSYLEPITSSDVQNYKLELFDSAGRLVWSAKADNIPSAPLPAAAGAYFWRADLECFTAWEGIIYESVSGKLIIVD